ALARRRRVRAPAVGGTAAPVSALVQRFSVSLTMALLQGTVIAPRPAPPGRLSEPWQRSQTPVALAPRGGGRRRRPRRRVRPGRMSGRRAEVGYAARAPLVPLRVVSILGGGPGIAFCQAAEGWRGWGG